MVPIWYGTNYAKEILPDEDGDDWKWMWQRQMIEIHLLEWMKSSALGTWWTKLRHIIIISSSSSFSNSRPFVRFSYIDFQLWKSIVMNYISSLVTAFHKLNILWNVIWKAVKIKLNNSNSLSMVTKEEFRQLSNNNTICTILPQKIKSFRQ